MKKALIGVCIAGTLLSSAAQADRRHRARGTEVNEPARKGTPYLENVRGVGAILRNNIMGLLDPSAPSFSLFKSILYSKRILKVARLFAYGAYVREIESNPEKYGRGEQLTTAQMRERSAFLSQKLRIVFKKGYKGLLKFDERAKAAVDDFYYRIESIISTRNPAEQFKFSRWEGLIYLKLIEDEGHFQEKGPRYTHVYPKTGAVETRYYFTWTTVTVHKLAEAVVNDRFQLMKQVRKIAKATLPEFEDSLCCCSDDDSEGQGDRSSDGANNPQPPSENPQDSDDDDDDVSLPDDIPMPDIPDDDIPMPDFPDEGASENLTAINTTNPITPSQPTPTSGAAGDRAAPTSNDLIIDDPDFNIPEDN